MRFIIFDVDLNQEPRNRAFPLVLAVPSEIKNISEEKAKNLVLKIFYQKNTDRRWNKRIALSEKDAEFSPEIKKMFEFVDWSSVPNVWLEKPENSQQAKDYVDLVGPAPSVENLISMNTYTAYRYAMDVLEDRFFAGEEAIGKDPLKSFNYALKMKCRIVSGEESIAKSDELAFKYGKLMKNLNLWGSWTEEEISKSPVWMYQYAKDYLGGSLPERLHNKMHLLGFSNNENRWIKKYLGAKKYMSKK